MKRYLCLGLIILVCFTFACKTAVLTEEKSIQTEGTFYNKITLYCDKDPIIVILPKEIPNFTIDENYTWRNQPLKEKLALLQYWNPYSLESTPRYGFVTLQYECGVFAFITKQDKKSQYWIYKNGLPIPASEDAFNKFCDILIKQQIS